MLNLMQQKSSIKYIQVIVFTKTDERIKLNLVQCPDPEAFL